MLLLDWDRQCRKRHVEKYEMLASQLRDGSHHGNWERLEKSSRLMIITDSGRDLDERCGEVWGVDAG